jgi:hypothetical protein
MFPAGRSPAGCCIIIDALTIAAAVNRMAAMLDDFAVT